MLQLIGVAVLLISALLTAIYMFSPIIKAFFPRENTEINPDGVKEAKPAMLIPMGICAVLCIVMGIFVKVPVEIIGEVLGL